MQLTGTRRATLLTAAAIWGECDLLVTGHGSMMWIWSSPCCLSSAVLHFWPPVSYETTCGPLKGESLRMSWLRPSREGWAPTTRSSVTSCTGNTTACFLPGEKETVPGGIICSVWLLQKYQKAHDLLIPNIGREYAYCIDHKCRVCFQVQRSGAFHPGGDWQVTRLGDGGKREGLSASPHLGAANPARLLFQ